MALKIVRKNKKYEENIYYLPLPFSPDIEAQNIQSDNFLNLY
jgi:hypothetical protein